jgi:hypothetical protein
MRHLLLLSVSSVTPVCEAQLLTGVNGAEPNHIVLFHALCVYFTKDIPESEHT